MDGLWRETRKDLRIREKCPENPSVIYRCKQASFRKLGELQLIRMQVTLVPIDRENHRAMWRLTLKPEQQGFVSPPAWSLARCFVKVFGDRFEHLPHLIYAGNEPIGFSTIVCDPASAGDYWIDDIMIDEHQQGHGYGRAAVIESIKLILRRYPRCRAIQLTCFRANINAAALYLSLGFVLTGVNDPVFNEPNYKLSGPALDNFREA